MRRARSGPGEVGRVRLEFSPELELSLPETHQLAALIDGWARVKGVTLHWRADRSSPEVAVQATYGDYEHALDQLLSEVGGFGRLGTIEDSFAERPEQTRGRALVVTPHDDIREIAVMYLSVMGLEVDDVVSIHDARACVREVEYDLLVVGNTDLGDGDVAGLLEAIDPYVEMTTPVLFWTGGPLAQATTALNHLRVPLMVAVKPNDFAAFRDKVTQALEWRHLIRLRGRVRERVEELVSERMKEVTRDERRTESGQSPSPAKRQHV